MKHYILLVLAFVFGTTAFAQNYRYEFEIKNLQDSVVYLINYYGEKQYYNDTAVVDLETGRFVFEGEGSKPGGVYAILFGDKRSYFEMIINEPSFSVTGTFGDIPGSIEFEDSKENDIFYEWVAKMGEMQRKIAPLQAQVKEQTGAEKKKTQGQLDDLFEELKAYRANFFSENEGTFAAKVFKASEEVEIPEVPAGVEDAEQWRYEYYKAHYWDNIELSDDRMIRTPIIHNKIEKYIKTLTPQFSDSICASVKTITDISGEGSLIYRYTVQFTLNEYNDSKIMGLDDVFVCLAENYYTQGKATWLDSNKTAEIVDRYEVLKNLTLGSKASDIILPDLNNEWKSLFALEADYKILVFWDPNCGHCKKEMPKLHELYEKHEELGFEVYAVCTEFENDDWKKYCAEHKHQWVDVSDNPEINQNAWDYINSGKTTLNSLNYRDYWDIFSTPKFFILDKDNIIIGKRIGPEQIPDFIEKHREKQLN